MTILYDYVAGSPPCYWLAIICFIVFILCVVVAVANYVNDGMNGIVFILFFTAFLVAVAGAINIQDTQYHAVKATINETVSWEEVNSKYELIDQEGAIYTFKVKEDNKEKE